MVTLCFEVQGDPEAPESTTFEMQTPSSHFSLKDLSEIFPYEGTFHFRQKVPLPGSWNNYGWMDLTDPQEEIQFKGTRLEIRVGPY